MSTAPQSFLTPQQYLTCEREASFKSEFYRGETFAMAGASREHNLIVGNIVGEVRNSLKSRDCEVYPSDLRVKVSATGLYTYPDATVVCEDPQFEDDQMDTLINPTVLFEVLSKSTESYDRGTKFAQYRSIASLKEVVLITQDRFSVESFVRRDDGSWLLRETVTLDESAEFSSISVTVPMSEIYRNVKFKSA
ncbi:hypothetical protein LF1_39870 [Rubripirellula obstinata]|uniref:Putative restriction endonuclease domain-containing protein n=1 Tax=Rubripirellula obstinata TaxID=406547 RepID=A0A5B1CNQ2_9BACT|nr:Uma2 family endonuclease [Rubripirellula obstinata]KAA1261439.1 hypothetical protein LF1_39870 [Rubripirellula obstinata]